MTERVETTLRWVGDWPWWAGIGGALVLGLIAWLLYRRDIAALPWWLRLILPAMRALAVVMIVLMLSGPVLHHRKTIGELARLWVLVDGSASMGLADPSMDLGRKALILQRLGLLAPDAVKLDLPRAAEALANAQAAAQRSLSIAVIDPAQWKKATDEFEKEVSTAHGLIRGTAGNADRLERFRRELIEPTKALRARTLQQIDDRNRAVQDLARLGEAARRWQTELQEEFANSVTALASADSPLRAAIAKFDSMPRSQRVQAMLLETGEKKLLGELAQRYEVQLLAVEGESAKLIWQPTAKTSALPAALPKPLGEITDLAAALRTGVGGQEKALRGADRSLF